MLYDDNQNKRFDEYKTQAIAFDAFKRIARVPNDGLCIMTREIFSDEDYGKRQYIITNYLHFFVLYNTMPQKARCYYEMIRDGLPCKLYFDIEYLKKYNKFVNGDELVFIFKEFLILYILSEFNIKISHTDIIDLTSSTNFKFSRHLIILLPNNYIFSDNYQCGIFVNKLCDTIQRKAKMGRYYNNNLKDMLDIDKRLRILFISDHLHSLEKDRLLFIDKSVYSKNRCFRLIYSSKLKYIHSHTPVTLLPSDPSVDKKYASNKDKFIYFMQTLICTFNDNLDLNYIDFSSKTSIF